MPARRTSYTPSYTSRGSGGGRPRGGGGRLSGGRGSDSRSASAPPERRSASVVLVLLAMMVGLAAFGWLQNHNAALPGGARLIVLAGQTTVERTGAGPHALAAGQAAAIQAGDTVRVVADGRALLALDPSHSIELSGGSHVALLELVQAPFTRASDVRLALHAGTALARLGDAASGGASLIFETAALTVASSGGVVSCQALASDHVLVAVYEGGADISMGDQALALPAGQGVDAWLGQPLIAAPVSGPAPTMVPIPGATDVAATGIAVPATLTDREKTLFPKVLTPTRPGDPPVSAEGAATPGAGTSAAGTAATYTVVKGDTLFSIAQRYGVSWEALWEANKDILPKPEMLQVGQQLRIPAP